MNRLFSYCIPYDDGAAPNPYGGICTLAICKPRIRSVAKIGDWIVGTGSIKSGFANQVVYAMKVTGKMSMKKYDALCREKYPSKIPDWYHKSDYSKRVGDCIYDFSVQPPLLRKGVHSEGNRKTDLGGKNALISDHFYYFGNQPKPLPKDLLPIVNQTQGHKSNLNKPYFEEFVKWIEDYNFCLNKISGEPGLILPYPKDGNAAKCAKIRKEAGEKDKENKSSC